MKWSILKSTYAFQSKWLRVRKDHVRLPSGHEMDDFYVVETNDWVNIIAVTEDDKILIEEQYRHGIQRVCFELPAGNIDVNEPPLEAAKRELLEETGYGHGNWTLFYQSAPNTSGMSTLCHTFLATSVKQLQEPHREQSEDIKLHLKTKTELQQLLNNQSIIEGVMQAPLYKYILN